MTHLCGRPIPGTNKCNLGRETAIQKVEWRDDDWLYLTNGGNEPDEQVQPPPLEPCPWDELPNHLPFDSPHFAIPRGPSSSVIIEPDGLTLVGMESLESNFEQAMLARRLTSQRLTATTKLSFQPENFQQMAGMAAYYNTYLFHYLYLSNDEEKGLCLQIHSCDDGSSTFPLGPEIVPVTGGPLYLRAIFVDSSLEFQFSHDGEYFKKVGPTLDASILSDDHGKHWGFTGTFIALACQDLSGNKLPAFFHHLETTPNAS